MHQVQNVSEKWDLWQDNQSFLRFNFRSRLAEQASICQRNDSWGLPAFGCLDADRLTRVRHAQILAFGSECQQEIRSLSKQTRHFRCSDSIIWIGSRSKLLYVNGTILKDAHITATFGLKIVYILPTFPFFKFKKTFFIATNTLFKHF